jgi:hypothetical protein
MKSSAASISIRGFADAVDSAEGSEMQQNHPTTQVLELKRFGVDPFVCAFEFT